MNHVWDLICRVIFDKVLCSGRAVMIIQHCPIEQNTQQVVYGLCGSFFTLNKKKKIDNLAISIFPRSSIKQPKTAFLCKSEVLDKYS